MRVKAKNFRAIEHADIRVDDGPTLVLGGNGAGKTSLRVGVGWAIAPGDKRTTPFNELLSQGATSIVRTGTKRAQIHLEGDAGSLVVTWPKASRMADGTPPSSDPVVAGWVDPLAMPAGPWSDWLLSMCGDGAELSAETIIGLMIDADDRIDQKAASIWATKVEQVGWDAAGEEADKRRLECQRDWCKITGARSWQPKHATTWAPEDWEETRSLAELEAAAAQASEAHLAAVSDLGGNKAKADRLRALAANAPELRAQAEKVEAEWTRLERESFEAAGHLIPDESGNISATCPQCKATTRYSANPRAVALTEQARGAQIRLHDLQARLREAEAATAALAETGASAEPSASLPDGVADKVEALQQEARHAQALVETARQIHKARIVGAGAERGAVIAAMLKPNGLRARLLDQFADDIQSDLDLWAARLCGPGVKLWLAKDQELGHRLWIDDGAYHGSASAITYGLDDPSGKLARARIALQMVGWSRMRCDLMCIEASALDGPGQAGLLQLLLKHKVPALVTLKSDNPESWASTPLPHIYALRDGRSVAIRED